MERASQVVLVVKNPPANVGDERNSGWIPWFAKIPWTKAGQPTLVFLPGEYCLLTVLTEEPGGLQCIRSKRAGQDWGNLAHTHECFQRRQWQPAPVLLPGKFHAKEPGRLQSMGSLRVGNDWATSLSLLTFMHWRRKWQPTPVSLPGESQGRGSLVGSRLWGRTESDTTEAT